MGLAGLKFSTSPRIFGKVELVITIRKAATTKGVLSFTVNRGWNLILSIFDCVFVGLEDPFSCSKIMCVKAMAAMTIGSMKCSEKNRFKVG